MKRILSLFLSLAMVLTMCGGISVSAATKDETSTSKSQQSEKKVTKISVPETKITLKVGETYKVTPTFKPSDATNKKYTVTSSDKKVATVSKGVITAVKAGTAKITVKAADGSGKKVVITVTVKKASSGSSSSSSASKNENESSKTPASTPAKPSGTANVKTTGGFDAKKTSMQITSEMRLGWNLGNSLDALGTGMSSEMCWGNPKTTKAMINDIKAAGFNTIRIPVSWGKHCNAKGVVDKEWMDRVKEVVDYAYKNNMYVILNSHHDNAYYDIGSCSKDDNTLNESIRKMKSLWTQISNTFKDYDERLIFETMNEPRTEGSPNEWNGGTAAEREVVYRLNAEILSAIRATGGNNALRHVMMPSYAATSSMSILRQMKFPEDDRIILSVHAYSPYNFAMNDKGPKEFTDRDRNELDRFFSDLDKNFISKGIPVVVGEFGCINKNNQDQRVAWSEFFVSTAKQYGIPCIWWDNNSGTKSGSESFGIYSRNKEAFDYIDIVNAMVKASK